MKRVLFYMAFVSVIWQVKSQNIQGTVVDGHGQPVEFANVALYSLPDTIFITGTTTSKEGEFVMEIPVQSSDWLLRASFIGYRNAEQVVQKSMLETKLAPIVLHEESIGLNEVTVTAIRPVISSRNGIISTTIENTLLSREHSVMDVLTKIPGIVNNRGNFEVFGKGEPVVYINNRKVQDKSEIAQLDVKNIKNIELITNPGAEYDADTNAVLKIYTLKRNEGLFIQSGAGLTSSEKMSYNGNFRIGYVEGKFSASAYYSYYGYANKSYQHLIKEIQSDTLWEYETDRNSLPTQKIHNYNLNVDYEFSKSHIAGMQLSGTRRSSGDLSREKNNVKADNADFHTFDVESKIKMVNDNPQLNFFYNSNLNEKLSSQLNLDFVYYNDERNQQVDESTLENSALTETVSRSTYKIYAAKYVMDYQPSPKNSLVFGADVSQIDGWGDLKTKSEIITPLEYESREAKYAGFAEYDYKGGKLSVNAGLRYEKVISSYTDMNNRENDLEENYNDLYPSFKISFSDKGINHSLSYTVRTQRPALSYLNSKTYYQNQFMYQQGNPLLKPQTSYILEYLFGYKFINLGMSYTRTDNYISSTFIESTEYSSVIISTWENFRKAEFLRANINLQYSVKAWSPYLSIGITKPFLKSEYQDRSFTYNKLNFYIMSSNYINLPQNYLLSINYYFNNGGNQRIFIFEPFQSLNLGIQKNFLIERLSVSVKANDLFRTLNYKETTEINNLRFYQNENYSEWNFSLGVIFRFNQNKTKYRGKSAAENETKRLN